MSWILALISCLLYREADIQRSLAVDADETSGDRDLKNGTYHTEIDSDDRCFTLFQ